MHVDLGGICYSVYKQCHVMIISHSYDSKALPQNSFNDLSDLLGLFLSQM